jgi:ligand-binding SRPBCC domain-containing protein
VTWEAVHFGIRQQLTTYIEKVDRPRYFADRMVRGAFKCFFHEHFYEPQADGTLMTDKFHYEVPYGIAGKLFDALVLNRYMTRLLQERNNVIKQVAESGEWKRYF